MFKLLHDFIVFSAHVGYHIVAQQQGLLSGAL